jgi:hypothetical protein
MPRTLQPPTTEQVDLRAKIQERMAKIVKNAEAISEMLEGDPGLSEESAIHSRLSLMEHLRDDALDKVKLAFTVDEGVVA